jgi:hypothetical protein
MPEKTKTLAPVRKKVSDGVLAQAAHGIPWGQTPTETCRS